MDAYEVAEQVQRGLPEENVALEDIISALVIHGGCFEVIEFNPRTMLEIVFPESAGNGDRLEQNARSAAYSAPPAKERPSDRVRTLGGA